MSAVLDLFAGPGGWDVAARDLDIHPVGIEVDAAACATRAAAGLHTIRADVATFPACHLAGRLAGLIGSPPCQAFSNAGKRDGHQDLDRLHAFIDRYTVDGWHDPGDGWADPRTPLLLHPLRFAELRPAWIALEQVPPVLPLWEAMGRALATRHRFRWWAGVLNAADYGVPQTRERAFLLARLDRQPVPPAPTHCKGGASTLLGELAPWVSMAEALGIPTGMEARKLMGAGMVERHGDRPARAADEPAWTVRANGGGNASGGFVFVRTGANTMKHGRTANRSPLVLSTGRDWQPDGSSQAVPIDDPAPNVTAKAGGQWVFTELDDPTARLVSRDQRAAGRGDRTEARPGAGAGTEAIQLTVEQALILQSFPPDYPVAGAKTKQFEQIGNAVPPRLAWHVLSAVAGGGTTIDWEASS